MAKACRMKTKTLIACLRGLHDHGYIRVTRGRRYNHYVVLVPKNRLYIDHRLDEAGLSPAEIRVLAHISRLGDDTGRFFVNYEKFAAVCGMSVNTVKSALDRLLEGEMISTYEHSADSFMFLLLHDLYPTLPANRLQ